MLLNKGGRCLLVREVGCPILLVCPAYHYYCASISEGPMNSSVRSGDLRPVERAYTLPQFLHTFIPHRLLARPHDCLGEGEFRTQDVRKGLRRMVS
jgi:hypothetical protein